MGLQGSQVATELSSSLLPAWLPWRAVPGPLEKGAEEQGLRIATLQGLPAPRGTRQGSLCRAGSVAAATVERCPVGTTHTCPAKAPCTRGPSGLLLQALLPREGLLSYSGQVQVDEKWAELRP